MSRSADENRHGDQRFHSPSTAWHTNLAVSYDQPFDVTHHQSAYEHLPTARYVSYDFVPPDSTRIPNPVPNPTVFNDHLHPSCPAVVPEKHWYYKPVVTSASFYAHGAQTVSKPATVVESIAPPNALLTLSSPSVEGDKCHSDGDVNKNCDKTNEVMKGCIRMPTEDLSKILPESSCNYTAMEPSSEVTAEVCSNKMDIATSVSGSDSTAAAAVSSVAPRPKCGRAKTNAELKRQLMERREQRLRDMQDHHPECIVPSSASTSMVSTSLCKQTEANPVLVS